LDPNFADAWRNLGSVLVQQGLHSEAITAFRRAQELAPSNWGLGLLAHALSVSGNRPEAARILSTLLRGTGGGRPLPALAIATAYTGLGPPQEAYSWLEQAAGEGQDFRVAYLQVDPLYGSLRADPRFGAVVARLRLR